MRRPGLALLFAFACAGCRAGAPPDGQRGNEPPASPPTSLVDPVSDSADDDSPDDDSPTVEVLPSPNGLATLILVDSAEPGLDVVSLVARGDTTWVTDCNACKHLGLHWLTPDLGRVWIPIGGNYHHSAVFAEASTGRASPLYEDDVAVDAKAGTLITWDFRTLTLRDLWSGRALASWAPPDVNVADLWQGCEPVGTLSGRAATIRYDCGDGVRERVVDWKPCRDGGRIGPHGANSPCEGVDSTVASHVRKDGNRR